MSVGTERRLGTTCGHPSHSVFPSSRALILGSSLPTFVNTLLLLNCVLWNRAWAWGPLPLSPPMPPPPPPRGPQLPGNQQIPEYSASPSPPWPEAPQASGGPSIFREGSRLEFHWLFSLLHVRSPFLSCGRDKMFLPPCLLGSDECPVQRFWELWEGDNVMLLAPTAPSQDRTAPRDTTPSWCGPA